MAGVLESSWPFPLLCPLARSPHCAQPPQGAEMLRDRLAASGLLSRIVAAANLTLYIPPPTALGGYRPWRCQVAEKGPPIGAKRSARSTQTRPPKGSADVFIAYAVRRRLIRSGAGASFHGAIGTVGVDVERASRTLHHFARDNDLFDPFQTWKIEHGVKQNAFENGARAARAGLAFDRLAGNRTKPFVGEGQLDVLHLEQPLILLHQRVLRIGQELLQRSLVEILQRRDHGQAADELRNQAVLQQILGLDVAEDLAGTAIFRRQNLRRETDRGRATGRRG